MIGIFINLPDDLIKQVKKFIAPTPTAEIMKTHIQRWTRKNYFHLWFRDHYRQIVSVLRGRAYKRMRYIKENQYRIIKLLNKKGENMTIEKLINVITSITQLSMNGQKRHSGYMLNNF